MRRSWPIWVIFAIVGTAEFLWGFYSAHMIGYMPGDAISRVANAFYVIFSRDPHLGSIGFIWNPLPSLLELIPLMLWVPFPAVASSGLAGVIVTAAFAAGTAVLLYVQFRKAVPKVYTVLLLIGWVCNPFVFIYGANGMSEIMFAFSIAWLVIVYCDWMNHGDARSLIHIGLALSLGFWIRYEMVAIGFAVACCMILHMYDKWRTSIHRHSFKEWYAKTESTLLLALLPPVFSGLLWILFNYVIMGDPLYFLHSDYSNTAWVQDKADELVEISGNLVAVLSYVTRRMLFFSIPAIAIVVLRFLTGRWRQPDMLAFILLVVSIPAMQAFMLYQGTSYGWLRFFFSPLIVAMAWLPYEWKSLALVRRKRPIFAVFSISVLLASLIFRDMNDQSFAPDDYGAFHMRESETTKDLQTGREIARYIDELIESRKPDRTLVLMDSFSAFATILSMRHQNELIITNNRDFQSALLKPQEHGVNYILVSQSEGATLHVIHEVYPELFDEGLTWTELVRDFGDEWRLYRVLPAAESPAN